jgi:hypothetical protein
VWDEDSLEAVLNDSNTTTLVSKYKLACTPEVTLDELRLGVPQDPTDPTAPRKQQTKVIGAVGTGPTFSFAAPREMCLVAKLAGEFAGRRYHGRMFLPFPISASDIAGELITTSSARYIAYNDFMLELAKTFQPSGGSHYGGAWNDVDAVVVSRAARIAGSSQYWTRIQNYSLPAKLHWLRSRGTAP